LIRLQSTFASPLTLFRLLLSLSFVLRPALNRLCLRQDFNMKFVDIVPLAAAVALAVAEPIPRKSSHFMIFLSKQTLAVLCCQHGTTLQWLDRFIDKINEPLLCRFIFELKVVL